jgi:hypothetical protein
VAYGRYFLNNDHERAKNLCLIHQTAAEGTAAEGVDLCREFRAIPPLVHSPLINPTR